MPVHRRSGSAPGSASRRPCWPCAGRSQPGSPHAALCQRVERYHAELFTFVADPAVPPTNNARGAGAAAAGRSARKISGGTRSSSGSRTRMMLQSVIATWELRGLDPLAEMLTLLRAPRYAHPRTGPGLNSYLPSSRLTAKHAIPTIVSPVRSSAYRWRLCQAPHRQIETLAYGPGWFTSSRKETHGPTYRDS